MEELSSRYIATDVEDKWYKEWEDAGYFLAKADPKKNPFCIVIPPPNVTGILHMGHALNNTIQDILIRFHRMNGHEALWMPGTDHAGIATQNVVEKTLAKEGLKRQDLGRDKFLKRVWEWKEHSGSTIIRQLKKLGASCDWSRARFTMDEDYSESVKSVFVALWEKGLIYQGNRVINWCPRCQTALSDEEAPHQDLEGSFFYIRYPFKDTPSEYVVVATTRPETLLGDTAVAVNPEDVRYKKFIGKTLILPLLKREIKIIAESTVDMEFGTGAVKITPAHDPNDYLTGKKHNLEFINVMHPDGRMNDAAGPYKEMDRFKAREVILADLKDLGLLEKTEPHALSAGHCYRCHTIIEPYLSKQWFVRMSPLAKPAIEVVKNGSITFHPARWTKVYLNWMENIQDWCISRQIWWGHRIPVFYCRTCQEIMVAKEPPGKCAKCASTDIYQDEDVLDTWFSSWLWPFATFYWPFESPDPLKNESGKRDLDYFYPTATLVTAPEIIFFWVARMIMAGLEFKNKIPFKDVYIHGTVRDIEGKKMSKSLGNVIDPIDIIKEYGTDALRFSLISITAQGQDVFLSKERFEQGRNFANKIWNASRFILMNLDASVTEKDLCVFVKNENLDTVNRWILSRFYSVLTEIESDLKAFKFNEAANLLYSFFWHEFCDWYLELVKPRIKDPHNQLVMYKILEKFLRVIHPFMPFITEEIWHKLDPKAGSIMRASWPHVQKNLIDKNIERDMELVFETIITLRNIRQELEVPLNDMIEVTLCTGEESNKKALEEMKLFVCNLVKLSNLHIADTYVKTSGEFVTVLGSMHVVIPLAGVVDIEKHQKKIQEKISKCMVDIASKAAMLEKSDFVNRAPADIIEKEKEKLRNLKEMLTKQKAVLDGLT